MTVICLVLSYSSNIEFYKMVFIGVRFLLYFFKLSSARSVRESICLRFLYRPRDEGARSVRKNPEGKYFPVRTEQMKFTRNLLYGFWLILFPIFITGFSLKDVCYLPYLVTCSLGYLFPPAKHSFIELLYN